MTKHSIASHEGARAVDPVLAVGRLGSLMSVCALVITESQSLGEGYRARAQDEIRTVLEFGAECTDEILIHIERALAGKAGAK